ncbi:MAG: hypothetical protein C0520_03705 [Sphingopyxis sp.]|nr:hypothetical protein [Sphingopyxis sp.]
MDDDEAIRDALCELLMVAGLACATFDGAPAFLTNGVAGHYDGLITDIRMPGMSGIELLDRLRVTAPELPTLVLTSVTDERDRLRALELGARAWLTKPVADDVLLDHLKAALGDGDFLWPEDDAG